MPVPAYNCATDSKQSTGHFQTNMKSLVFLLVLILCYLCGAQKHNTDNDIVLQAVESWEERAQIPRPRTESEGGEQEPVLQHDMIWAELMNLRDTVVEQKVELRLLTDRVTAAESLVVELQKENTGTLL